MWWLDLLHDLLNVHDLFVPLHGLVGLDLLEELVSRLMQTLLSVV